MRIHKPGKTHFSELKNIDRSPAHYKAFLGHEFESEDDLLIGDAFHSLVLRGIMPMPPFPGRRAGKEYEVMRQANGGRDLLTEKQYRDVLGMAEAVSRCEKAQTLLARCTSREVYREWTRVLQDGTIVECGGTPDADGPDIIIELKSTKSAQWKRFQRDAGWRRYPEQLVWYDVGCGTVPAKELTKPRDCYTIAVEKTWPYGISLHRLTPLKWLTANDRVERWLELRHKCELENYWPGWDNVIHDQDLDDYELGHQEEEEDEEN